MQPHIWLLQFGFLIKLTPIPSFFKWKAMYQLDSSDVRAVKANYVIYEKKLTRAQI